MSGSGDRIVLRAWLNGAPADPLIARALIEHLNASPLGPYRCGPWEPARTVLDAAGLEQAVGWLVGDPDSGDGEVFLESGRRRSTVQLCLGGDVGRAWYGNVDPGRFPVAGRPSWDLVVEVFRGLMARAPLLFGAISPDWDWERQHFFTEDDEDGGETVSRLGLDWCDQVPGVYAVNLFGPVLVQRFGREQLLGLPAAATADLGAAGILVSSVPQGGAPAPDVLRTQQARIRAALGPGQVFALPGQS